MFLRNVLFAMVGLAVVAAILMAIANDAPRDLTQLQIGVQWALLLIGVAVALAGIVELVMLAGSGRFGPAASGAVAAREPFARWTVVALMGLTIAQPNWATALAAGGVVVALVLAGVIAPANQNEPDDSGT